MRTTLFCICLLQFAVIGHAQNAGIPLHLSETGLWRSACTIGAESGQCIWDTGTNMSFLAETPVSMTYPVLANLSAGCSTTKISVAAVRPSVVRVGDIKKVDMMVARSNAYENLPQDLGVLGADLLLHNGQIIFDIVKLFGPSPMIYSNQQAESKRGNFPAFSPLLPTAKVVLEVRIAGVPAVAMWDTHAHTSFSKAFIANNPQMFALNEIQKIGDVCGGSHLTSVYNFKEKVCFGTTCVPSAIVIDSLDENLHDIGGGHYDLILGLDIINQVSWYFDFDLNRYSAKYGANER